MHADRGVLEVSTGQLLHEDFAFTRMTATRSADADGGNWFSISAELTKVRKVELRTAEVPAEERVSTQDGAKGRSGQTNKPGGKNGAQATTAPADGEARRITPHTRQGRRLYATKPAQQLPASAMTPIGLLDANDQLVEATLTVFAFHLGICWNEAGQLWTLSRPRP